VYEFVIQLFNELHHAHAVALADFFEHVPLEVFQANAGDHAVQAHGARLGGVAVWRGADKNFAHDVSPRGMPGTPAYRAGS
jgi:hypothetical protein